MYANITYQVSQQKQRDMMAAAERERFAQQYRTPRAPRVARSRSTRRTWHLVHPLRVQAQ